MTLEELRILRVIQGILVRNYINTQKLDVQVIGGSLYIEGELEVFEYHPGQNRPDPVERDLETARTLLHIEKEIRSLGEIAHIEFKLRNWQRVGARWLRTTSHNEPRMGEPRSQWQHNAQSRGPRL